MLMKLKSNKDYLWNNQTQITSHKEKKNFLLWLVLDFWIKKIKNELNVKKFIISKLNGGKLKEVKQPNKIKNIISI